MSKELSRIFHFYESNSGPFALAVVVHVAGSSYRRVGAKLLVSNDGLYEGGISGGCLEGDALKNAQMAILLNQPKVIRYDTSVESEIGIGLGCNGIIDVLFIPIVDAFIDHIRLIEGVVKNKNRAVLRTCCIIKSDMADRLGTIYLRGNLPLEFKLNIDQFNHSQTLEIGSETLLIEVNNPKTRVLIFGFQYDMYYLYDLLEYLEYEVIVIGPKSKLRNRVESLENIDSLVLDEFTAAVIMSHSIEQDTESLQALQHKSLRYIGILGPKSRTEKILLKLGEKSPEPRSLFYPIGLDIGTENPLQIALSIVAEIQAVMNQRAGGHLKMRTLPINNRL